LNNLYLTVYEARNNQYVKVSASESPKDNVQMVTMHAHNDVLVKVHLNGTLNKPDGDPGFAESFALAVSAGLTPKQAPSLRIVCVAPPPALPLQNVTVTCTASNNGQLPLSNTTVTANPGTVTSGSLGTMKAGATASFAVNVTASAQPGSQLSVVVNGAGTFLDESYKASTSFSINSQASDCVFTGPYLIKVPYYYVDPATGTTYPSKTGQSGTFQLTAPAGCAWNAYISPLLAPIVANSVKSWITISPMSGTGSATISYTVQPNLTNVANQGTVDFGQQGNTGPDGLSSGNALVGFKLCAAQFMQYCY
jgi:hypothetical protein